MSQSETAQENMTSLAEYLSRARTILIDELDPQNMSRKQRFRLYHCFVQQQDYKYFTINPNDYLLSWLSVGLLLFGYTDAISLLIKTIHTQEKANMSRFFEQFIKELFPSADIKSESGHEYVNQSGVTVKIMKFDCGKVANWLREHQDKFVWVEDKLHYVIEENPRQNLQFMANYEPSKMNKKETNTTMIYDITRTVSPETAPWTGDTPYSVEPVMLKQDGASVNLMTMTSTLHIGTHADAYYHYDDDGAYAATMPLEHYIGRARVVTVEKESGALTLDDLTHVDLVGGERLLIHSVMSSLPDSVFPDAIPYLSVELIEHLALLGYKLIGLDSPSVDALDSKDLPCHHAIQANGMVNLENLMLDGVPDGDYELVALPLKLDLACASPVRAILRTLTK